jgi:hypothetical protein
MARWNGRPGGLKSHAFFSKNYNQTGLNPSVNW